MAIGTENTIFCIFHETANKTNTMKKLKHFTIKFTKMIL